MVSTPTRTLGSPDPLALDEPSSNASGSGQSPAKGRRSTPRSQIVVEIETSRRKRRAIGSSSKMADMSPNSALGSTSKPTPARTPLAKGSGASNRGTSTPRHKNTPTGKTPLRGNSAASPAATKTPRNGAKASSTLASSVKKALPTPVRSRKEEKAPIRLADDNPFLESDAGTGVSRETFLANEALRRQKEARNFEYEGDADAPKLTRSGKVVGGAKRGVEIDEYGGMEEEEDDADEDEDTRGKPKSTESDMLDNGLEARALDNHMEVDERPVGTAQPAGLPPGARPHVLRILSTLTSQGIASDPPPFMDEDTNEALHGLVNLLKATVERGEGNSALVVGPRGVGKTRTLGRALNLLPSTSTSLPIVVRLSGHAQTSDRLAIREIGRQIAEAEGISIANHDDDEAVDGADDQEYAPTTLPSHLLALLTAPSPRAIIIVIEEFDMFTEHARQALLYCLLDVVQSIKTGDVKTTGRGVAVIGVTCRVDTLLLLEKRVKSRFSHRMWRIPSPLSPGGPGWKTLLNRALVPWEWDAKQDSAEPDAKALQLWKDDWQYGIETLLDQPKVVKYLDRLTGLTTDVRILYKPFVPLIISVLSSQVDLINVAQLCASVLGQIEQSGWGLQTAKLKGLSQPSVGILIISKHLHYAGRDEFNFAQVEEEYLRFSRTKLVGSGKTRWPIGVLRNGYEHLLRLGLLAPAGSTSVQRRFAKVRCTLSAHEIVAWMRGEGASGLGPELVSWGRMLGGHA
ncbi:origin recognition complex subunit 4 C-terminus-domain-containing protein [Kockovaella imperatae]|uniref:Origin recognition complex subunit 4 C-terminus-domain-containing protein n=1 Tax=Kockovaella imperatae TaxID=4999 RepID=A0A1Y1UN20_9TREE|nr:origin recognition complex subunit 4 C-terminus-domain-containing protein [Kockovaella imperatae]ORX39453.1 origin recognition complex subunit 4 C-terminus-domain-containing protein [Kockovaella imperatae]